MRTPRRCWKSTCPFLSLISTAYIPQSVLISPDRQDWLSAPAGQGWTDPLTMVAGTFPSSKSKSKKTSLSARVGDGTRDSASGRFDLILLLDVLEHIRDDVGFLR